MLLKKDNGSFHGMLFSQYKRHVTITTTDISSSLGFNPPYRRQFYSEEMNVGGKHGVHRRRSQTLSEK